MENFSELQSRSKQSTEKSFLNPGIRSSINKIFEKVLKKLIHLDTRSGSSSQLLAGLTSQKKTRADHGLIRRKVCFDNLLKMFSIQKFQKYCWSWFFLIKIPILLRGNSLYFYHHLSIESFTPGKTFRFQLFRQTFNRNSDNPNIP